MRLVIDILEDTYKATCSGSMLPPHVENVVNAIKNGTPLPKGHGRIVDIGPYEGKVIASRKYCGVNKLVEVAELDTIIEADKEQEDDKI